MQLYCYLIEIDKILISLLLIEGISVFQIFSSESQNVVCLWYQGMADQNSNHFCDMARE